MRDTGMMRVSVLFGTVVILSFITSALGGCPNQCYHQGACTRGICKCYRGYAGADCVYKLEHEGSGMPAYYNMGTLETALEPLRIAVASAQVLGATFHDDLDVVIPGLTLARQLAAQKHNVTLIFNLHEQKDLELRHLWQKALAEEQIRLEVIYFTSHYYLPANLAHSFETYAWVSDFVQDGNPPFDVIFFNDGNGLPYISALAKHQDIPNCGLRDTLLVMGVQTPLLWLTTKGGGGGLKNVDELEINFIEHESARLVDHVVTSSKYFDTWMGERNWRLPWSTYTLPQPLPGRDLERILRLQHGTLDAPAPSTHRQFVFIIEGPGSGVLGKSVSSGRNANNPVSREVSKADEADTDRYSYVSADALTACEVASKLAGMLAEEELQHVVFSFFLLGADGGSSPHASAQIRHSAATRKWDFQWAVARGSSSTAVEHAASPGNVVLLQASRFRGGSTPVLVRRVVAAQTAAGEAWGPGESFTARPRAVVAAQDSAAELLRSFVAPSSPEPQGFVGVDTDDIMLAMLAAYKGEGPVLVPAQDEVELASASATWLNFLPWHTNKINKEIFSYDGTAHKLFMEVPQEVPTTAQKIITHEVGGVVITQPKDGSQISGVVLKGDPIVGESAEAVAPEDTSFRGQKAARQATRVARWSAQQLGVALESFNGTAISQDQKSASSFSPLYPPYRQPLVTVVITHYNRPKLLPLAVRSVAEQSYPNIQLVVVDDGSPNADVPAKLDEIEATFNFKGRGWSLLREPNRYLGGARNRGVEESKGEYILFMDDDNVAKPIEVEYFVQAMESTGADILTSYVDFVHGEQYPQLPAVRVPMASQSPLPPGFDPKYRRPPSFVFLGGSADVGIFKNCFGDANSFFRKSTFLKMGGYSTDRGIGYEDWELYSRAALKGYNLMVVAHSLYWYRFTGGSMQKTTSYSRSRQRALRAYIEALHEKREEGLASIARQQEEQLQLNMQCSSGLGEEICNTL